MRTAYLLGLSLVLIGCPASNPDTEAETSTTGAEGSGGDGDGDGDIGDGDGDVGDGDGDVGDGDGDGDSEMGNECDGFGVIEPDKTVSISVTNQGEAPRYVIVRANECPVYALEYEVEGEYQVVNNHRRTTCPCECPGFPGPGPEVLRIIEPAQTIELSWDGRRVFTCQYLADCTDWEPGWWEPDTRFAEQPAEPGNYRLSVAYFDTLPEECTPDGDGEYQCEHNIFGLDGPGACGADASASVELAVADGDVEVQLELP